MKRISTTNLAKVLIIFLITGCSPVGNGTSTSSYEVKIVNQTDPVYELIRTEDIDQPNCNGNGEVINEVERSMSVNHSIQVGTGYSLTTDGKLVLFGTGIDLGAAISSELGYQYGVTESIGRKVIVSAAPKTHMVHTIQLSEVWEAGTARVTTQNQSADIPFRFRSDFSMNLLNSKEIDCATGLIISTQIVSQPTSSVVQIAPSEGPTSITNSTGDSSEFQKKLASAQVTFKDDLDNSLFPGWLMWGGDSSTLYSQNGIAYFLGGAQLHRNHGIGENEACLFSLNFGPDTSFMMAGTPEEYGADWRAWGLAYNHTLGANDRMQEYFQEGIGESAINIYHPFTLQGQPNVSYKVLLWDKGPANFLIRVWDANNPDVFGQKEFQMKDPENWVDKKWYCNLLVDAGIAQVADYSEIKFPAP